MELKQFENISKKYHHFEYHSGDNDLESNQYISHRCWFGSMQVTLYDSPSIILSDNDSHSSLCIWDIREVDVKTCPSNNYDTIECSVSTPFIKNADTEKIVFRAFH